METYEMPKKHTVSEETLKADKKWMGKNMLSFEQQHIDPETKKIAFKFLSGLDKLMKRKRMATSNHKANGIKVICTHTEKIFKSITEAAEYAGVPRWHIKECCEFKRNSAGRIDGRPIVWRYYDKKLCEK